MEGFDLRVIEAIAKKFFDGHFTVMRFTTNWRVTFGTVESGEDIPKMPCGVTLQDAIVSAIEHFDNR